VIIIECQQGSTEWLEARAGAITASMFAIVRKKVGMLNEQQAKYVAAMLAGEGEAESMRIAGYKAKPRAEAIERSLAGEKVGTWSDAAKDYAFRLAIERISGSSLDEDRFETWSMRRGHELEPQARRAHEIASGHMVKPCGFVKTDDGRFGCSADGLIEVDGGSEYKCFLDPSKLRSIYLENDLSAVMDQVQGCMWITGRKFWHFGLYCPALARIGGELYWRHYDRDDDYIEAMEADLIEFDRFVDETEKQIRATEFQRAA
jgi:hypothetical protein